MSISFAAFSQELLKIAATRSAKEVRKAMAAGNIDRAEHIAEGSRKLGLKPRFIKELGGGQEASADIVMGRAPGQKESGGLMARKIYKPDSAITRGKYTKQLLEQKMKATKAGRQINPSMMPDMHGFQELNTPSGKRYVSHHEYVPNLEKFTESNWKANVDKIHDGMVAPLKQRGIGIRDAVQEVPAPKTFAGMQVAGVKMDSKGQVQMNRQYNPGNVGVVNRPGHASHGQQKIIDFLPTGDSDPANAFNQKQVAKGVTPELLSEGADYDAKALKKQVLGGVSTAERQGAKAKPGGALRLLRNPKAVAAGLGAASLAGLGAYALNKRKQRREAA